MRSLRSRIVFTYAVLIVVAMAALGAAVLMVEARRFRGAVNDRLQAEAGLVSVAAAPALAAGGGIARLDPLAKELGAESGDRVTIIASDGTVLGDSENDPRGLDNHTGRPEIEAARAQGVGRAIRYSTTEGRTFAYAAVLVRAPDGAPVGVVRVATPVSRVQADVRRIGLTVTAVAVVAAVLSALMGAVVAGAVTRPLSLLRRASRELARDAAEPSAGSPSLPIAGGGAEVQELAAAFADMAEQLRGTVRTLSEERSRLEALLASSADALAALDSDGIIRYLNPAAQTLLGPATGRTLAAAARNHELREVVRVALVAGSRATATLHIDERDTWVQATASPIAGGGGWAVLLILHDVTEVRRAETARRDFAANVSHELRTPLAGIKAVVETLRDGAIHDPDAADDFLGLVDAEVDRLVQLVEELLQLARIESGTEMHLDRIDPRPVLDGAVERFRLMAERAGVALSLDAPPTLPPIQGDTARLGQAVGNLVHNAIKFTPPGEAVTVTAAGDGDTLHIRVRDTGAGIDPADLPRIFERFYVADRARAGRAAGRGTGLGLAIVKHVVRAHNGTVEARSTPGRGSTFELILPVDRNA